MAVEEPSITENLRLSRTLIEWYKRYKRDLPWRNTKDPYLIWLSEVILQQTRVGQGRAYYERFALRFPDIVSLAEAGEDEVLKLWQGLGYYSRARNLHFAAQTVVEKYGGIFPSRYEDILSLKGVGEYTAAAIASFAFDEPYAVVDGNVFRVLSRIYSVDEPIDTGKGKKLFNEIASTEMDRQQAALHNQAIMEFGALQCVPVSPDCERCPATDFCLAYSKNEVADYPVKHGKTKVRNRYFYYFDIRQGVHTYIAKREQKDIWENLYEYPLTETATQMDDGEIISPGFLRKALNGIFPNKVTIVCRIKHVLSHQVIYATFIQVDVGEKCDVGYKKIEVKDLGDYPVSRLMDKYIIFTCGI